MDTLVLSEDGTALFFCCELEDHRLSSWETPSGKQLTFTADGVAIPLYSDNGIGDLRPLSDQDIAPVLTMADGSQIGHRVAGWLWLRRRSLLRSLPARGK